MGLSWLPITVQPWETLCSWRGLSCTPTPTSHSSMFEIFFFFFSQGLRYEQKRPFVTKCHEELTDVKTLKTLYKEIKKTYTRHMGRWKRTFEKAQVLFIYFFDEKSAQVSNNRCKRIKPQITLHEAAQFSWTHLLLWHVLIGQSKSFTALTAGLIYHVFVEAAIQL